MARLAAFVLLACVVLLVQGADDDQQQQPMSLFFKKESGQRHNLFSGDFKRRQPSRGEDSWDQDITTEDSWNEPATEESSWWHKQPAQSVSFRQDFGGRRRNYSPRDSRSNQPSRSEDTWDQDSTTEDSWNKLATEESSWWDQQPSESSNFRQSQPSEWEDPWQPKLPKSQEIWMEAPHWNQEQQSLHSSWDETPEHGPNQLAPESVNSWTEAAWTDESTVDELSATEDSLKLSQGVPLKFKCKGDGYYKHPRTCSKFIQCGNGIPYEKDCLSGLHFSLSSMTCQAPCDAFCDESLADECGWNSEGDDRQVKQGYNCQYDGIFSNPDSCESYVDCKNNVPHLRKCPNNLHFNSQSGECEPPCSAHCDSNLACQCAWSECGAKAVDCDSPPDKGQCDSLSQRYYFDRNSNRCKQFWYRGCRGNGNNYRTVEECEIACGARHITPPYHCPRPNGKYGDMYDCKLYYHCQDGQSTVKRCPRGQWFDHLRMSCTSDESATCLYTCPQPNGMYVYLPDCEKYVKCFKGKPTVVRCESGLAFNKQQRRCVPKSEVNCDVGPLNTTVLLQDSRDFRCPTTQGNYSKVDDCAKYWRCDLGVAHEEDCETEYFNPETRQCEDSKTVSCPAYEFGRKVICYFDNDTPSTRKIVPEDLSPYYCTHIHYAYAKLETTGETYSIASTNQENDIALKYYERVINLKKYNQKLKVLLTLGGWKDSDSEKYSQLVANVDKWPAFIESVIQYLKLHNFDGLEFDWEFPVCRTHDCKGKPPSATERQSFQSFLQMLYSRLSAQELLLSVRVSGQKRIFDVAYKMEEIGKVADYIVVMAYIPPGESQADTVPPSILNKVRNPAHVNEDAATIMALWKQKVHDSKKLILGVRADARVYQLSDSTQTDIYSPISPYGTEPQDMTFDRVCNYLQSYDWKRGSSPLVADYIYQDYTWIGYQSPESLRKFAEHVFRNNYGGVALISNQSDDFKGLCCHVKYPLLKGLLYGFTRKGLVPHDFGCP